MELVWCYCAVSSDRLKRVDSDSKRPRFGGAVFFRPTVVGRTVGCGRPTSEHGANKDNLAVFYFCGHSTCSGGQAALLFDDFGTPGEDFDGTVDLEVLRGTMRNSPAIQ